MQETPTLKGFPLLFVKNLQSGPLRGKFAPFLKLRLFFKLTLVPQLKHYISPAATTHINVDAYSSL